MLTFHVFFARSDPKITPRSSFDLPWEPLGAIWATLWASLGLPWNPLASLLTCQGTSWTSFYQFGTPKSPFWKDFQQNFNDFPCILVNIFGIFCLRFFILSYLNLPKFLELFPIPPNMSKASMPPCLQACEPPEARRDARSVNNFWCGAFFTPSNGPRFP